MSSEEPEATEEEIAHSAAAHRAAAGMGENPGPLPEETEREDMSLRSGPQFSGMNHEAGKALVREDPLAYSMLARMQGPEGETDRRYLLPITQAILDDIDIRLRLLERMISVGEMEALKKKETENGRANSSHPRGSEGGTEET